MTPTPASRGQGRARVLTAALLATATLFPVFTTTQAHAQEVSDNPEQALAHTAGTTCGPYGITEDDPRVNPAELTTTGASGEVITAENVDLHVPHVSAAGTKGTYHLFTRDVDFSEPVGVVVRLHGDGAYEYYYPHRLVNCQAEIAASHNMILVAPKAPSATEQGRDSWAYDLPRNIEWVSDLMVNEILPIDNIDPTNIVWVGYSGGAEFLTYGLIPSHPELITGGAMLLGGGGVAQDMDLSEVAQETLASVPLSWVVGTEDDGSDPRASFNALAAAERGSGFYQDQGLGQTYLYPLEGHDHFDLPQAAVLDQFLAPSETTEQQPTAVEITPEVETSPQPTDPTVVVTQGLESLGIQVPQVPNIELPDLGFEYPAGITTTP